MWPSMKSRWLGRFWAAHGRRRLRRLFMAVLIVLSLHGAPGISSASSTKSAASESGLTRALEAEHLALLREAERALQTGAHSEGIRAIQRAIEIARSGGDGFRLTVASGRHRILDRHQ